MTSLIPTDLHFVVSRIPKDVRALITEKPIYLGGGFIRASIANERAGDIDLFGPDKEQLAAAAKDLALERRGRLHKTDNALTLLSPPRMPVQFITRWVYDDPVALIDAFDFTIAQAVVWYRDEKWHSAASDRYYADLAARRLWYTSPVRDEAAGGSLLRARKFLAKGYTIQAPSLAAVVARLAMKVDFSRIESEEWLADVLTGLLREVDPLVVIDGVDLVDEHNLTANQGTPNA